MLKKITFFKYKTLFLFLFLNAFVYSQVKISIKNKEDHTAITNVEIYILETDQIFACDENGSINLGDLNLQRYTLKIFSLGFGSELKQIYPFKKSEYVFYLEQNNIKLEEVTLSGTTIQRQNDNPFFIESKNINELSHISAMNMGELISRIPGMYQASLGNGISKPVIRGMQGMRVVSLINGLRIEGQQWGGDHGMGMSQLGLGSVEIIKGPSSLLYGADALGGVIYYNDVPYPKNNSVELNAMSEYNSNTHGTVNRVMYKKSLKKLRWMSGIGYANHADFQLPNKKYALNSRFSEVVAKTSISYNTNKSIHHLRYTYNNTLSGIPGNSSDTSAGFLDFQVENQLRFHLLPSQYFSNHYLSSNNKWFAGKSEFQFLGGFTSNRLIEYDQTILEPSLSMTLNNFYHTFKWTYNSSKRFKWVNGIQGMLQTNKNAQNATDLLVPNSVSLDEGLFSIAILEFENMSFQGGLRYDMRNLKANDYPQSNEILIKNFQGLNTSLGMVYKTKNITYRTAISTGFRAPHLTELLSDGFHMAVLRYEIGDIDLDIEKATQLDFSMEIFGNQFSIVINPFINNINDYIYLQPIDSIIDGIGVFTYEQKSNVLFYGSDLGYHYIPSKLNGFELEGSFSIVRVAVNEENNISLIPQPKFQNTIGWQINYGDYVKINRISLNHTWMGPQNQVAFNEFASKMYNYFDLSMELSFGKQSRFSLNIGVKNLMNSEYIDHLSRLKNIYMPSPGRTYYTQLSYNFNSKK